jgi:hypothetical protein
MSANPQPSTRQSPRPIPQGERPMTTRLRSRHLLLMAGMTLLLGACGGASTPAATSAPNGTVASATTAVTGPSQQATIPVVAGPTTPGTTGISEPCSLLTQAEVDAAVGQPLGPGLQSLGRDCGWSATDNTAGVDVQVSDWAQTKTAATAPGNGPPISVPGVGDEAFYRQGDLYVRKGDAGFLVGIFGPHIDFSKPDGGLAQAKVLAAAILGRL